MWFSTNPLRKKRMSCVYWINCMYMENVSEQSYLEMA